MLQELREKTQGWIAGTIIGLLILTMGLWGISSYMHGGNASTGIIIKFAGGDITQTELDTAFDRFRMQNGNRLPEGAGSIKLLKQQLLEQLLTQKLLAQAAKHNNLMVGQVQIDSVLTQIPAFQVGGQFSRVQFEGILSQMLFTIPSFLENLQQTMLINQLQSGTMGSAFALPDDTTNGLALINQQRDFSYAILSKNRVANDVHISNADVQNYYQQHQQDFMLPEKISLQYVTLSAKEIMKKIKPTSAQLLKFYQDNVSNYTQPVRWQVAHILLSGDQAQASKIYQQAKAGDNFGALAAKYSQDPLSAKKAGVLPWFGPGQLDPSFEMAVAGLKKGAVSQPIKTKYGYEIIKLLQVQPQQILSYQQVSAKVNEAYLLQQAQKQFEDEKDQLSNVSFENPSSLKSAADALGLTIQTTPSFTRDDAKIGLIKLPQVTEAAFSQEVLEGNNSDVITTAPGEVVVIHLLSHQAASIMPLVAVSARIRQTLTDAAIKKNITTLGEGIAQAINVGRTEPQIAKQYGVVWRKASAQLKTKGIDPAILSAAFNLPRPAAKSSAGGVLLANNDYAVINVTKVIDGDYRVVSTVERKAFAEQISKTLVDAEYTEYMQYLHNHAKINYTKTD